MAKIGRPNQKPENQRSVKLSVYVTPEVAQSVKNEAKASGVSVSDFGFDLISHATASQGGVPLLGVIPGGDFDEIKKLPEGGIVTPPFALRPDCYALLVSGKSMQSNFGLSIEDGSYAFFCPEIMPTWGAPVHVEMEENGEVKCTFKRYCPMDDGRVELRPLNTTVKSMFVADDSLRIRGVFVRSWKGLAASQSVGDH